MAVPKPSDTMAFTLAGSGGNCNGCEWIAAEGPITQRTPEDFEAFLKLLGSDADGRETVRLSSNGGNLLAGVRLGEAIRAHKMKTEVGRTLPMVSDARWQEAADGDCYSACAYAFLGGIKRSAKSGQLGFHQFYLGRSVTEAINKEDLDASNSSAQQLMGLLVIYLREMSVEPGLLFFAASSKPGDLFKPDLDLILKLGITNMRENAYLQWVGDRAI